MASSLKNISALLSPRFRSPISPTKRLLKSASKSDGKVYHLQVINRSNVVKKLDFSEHPKHISNFSRSLFKTINILPEIKIDQVSDKIEVDEEHFSNKCDTSLDINTPNKLDLAKNGLENFKSFTRVLGKGAFGIVFRGKHKGQIVAVKIINKENYIREENALNLIHKNIIQTIEIIRNLEDQRFCLIIMEYLKNCKNLQDVLENYYEEKLLSLNKNVARLLKSFCVDITMGLEYCHKNGILHLDLKPKNILVNSENVCKICDFGNSARIEENLENFQHNGTVVYTAPEILLGQKPSTKSDIYSLGVIFWQIKYRRNPFQSFDTNESIIYNVGKFDVRPKCEEKSTDSLTKIFTKCWRSNPDSRPNTEQILQDLSDADFKF